MAKAIVCRTLIRPNFCSIYRLKRPEVQASDAYASDGLTVIEIFERHYDRKSSEMRYGWQATMVHTIFGHEANRGG